MKQTLMYVMKSLVGCSDPQLCTREEEKTPPLNFMCCHLYII